MPSLFEPCGLSQMIAMSYGTIPVARETGGLKDTVVPYNEYTGEGKGFTFANINAHEFLFVTKYACDLYRHHKPIWAQLIKHAMLGDYSWGRSAKEYAGLYSLITGISLEEFASQNLSADSTGEKQNEPVETPAEEEAVVIETSLKKASPKKKSVAAQNTTAKKDTATPKQTIPNNKEKDDKKAK